MVSSNGNGDARSAMVDGFGSVLREARDEKWSGDSVGQALGGFMTRPALQDVHSAWQRVQAIVDGWQHASDVF